MVAEAGQQNGHGSGLLAGKTCVVMGIVNRWSIAWAIAEEMAAAGGQLAVTYLDERTKREADSLTSSIPGSKAYQCNVESDEDLDALAANLKNDFGQVDALVHSIAYAPPAELTGRFVDTTREGFRLAHSISVYSLIASAQRIAPLMTNGGSISTMTYLGSQRAFPKYNVMGVAKAALEATVRYLAMDLGEQGIRVNAISAGPIKTASARGIPGFSAMQQQAIDKSPLGKVYDVKHVAGTAVFLASNLAPGLTGDVIFVDGGYHAMGI